MQVISLSNNLHFILIEKRERTVGIRYLTLFAKGLDMSSTLDLLLIDVTQRN
jgi:hypothetical protein